MPFYEIAGVVPVCDPTSYVHPPAVVMDGALIGADSLVGAGSVVRAGFTAPPRSLVLGSPARVVRELDADQLAWKSNGPEVYQQLARRSLATLREVTPLVAEETGRSRVSTDASVSRPLHELRAERRSP